MMEKGDLDWQLHWKRFETIDDASTFYGHWATKEKTKLILELLAGFPDKTVRVLDVGCGSGATLDLFRRVGFTNLYGVDNSLEALHCCERYGMKIGLNLFKRDARKTYLPYRSFGIVFEEGLWEHFRHYQPFVYEMCRLTHDYLIAIQPNHFSLVGAATKIGWELFSRNRGSVREYSIPLGHIKRLINACEFKLETERFTPFKTFSCMLFRRWVNGRFFPV